MPKFFQGLVKSPHNHHMQLSLCRIYALLGAAPSAVRAPVVRLAEMRRERVLVADEDGGGRWQFAEPTPREGWTLRWDDVSFTAQTTPFRHLGFFPDMAPVWGWMRERLAGMDTPECLNLFGYTGVGTLALAQPRAGFGGARMVHVDASKKSVEAARANAAMAAVSVAGCP